MIPTVALGVNGTVTGTIVMKRAAGSLKMSETVRSYRNVHGIM